MSVINYKTIIKKIKKQKNHSFSVKLLIVFYFKKI